jgi:predicted nuclease with TOPRIM domain
VKELEAKVTALEEVTSKMADENSRLKSRLLELEAENNSLKGANLTVTFPVTPSYDTILMKAIQGTTRRLFNSPF